MDEELEIDDHEILDMSAKAEIILHGLRYAVLFKDIDVLRKTVIDLQDCAYVLDAMVERMFSSE